MAPGICVTSFRMLIRRTELSSHLCRGLRLTPSGSYIMNSWSARSYCKKQDDASIEEQQRQENDLTQLKITQLRAQLRVHGLSSVGKKEVLLQRLKSYLKLEAGKHIPYDVKDNTNKDEDGETKTNKAAEPNLADEKGESPKLILLHDQKLAETSAFINSSRTEVETHKLDNSFENSFFTGKPDDIMNPFSEAESVGKYTSSVNSFASNGNEISYSKGENIRDHSFIEPAVESVAEQPDGDVYVEYIQGLPHLTVPLPSRLEKCRFALRPVSHKVGDLIEMLKIEDHGIDRAVILNRCGVRIASTCAIDSLLDEPFCLQINDNKYEVIPPKRKKIDSEDLKSLSDVRTLVAQLYEALHVGEYHLYKEQELVTKLENLKFEISPLEMEKQELTKLAERKTVIATWVGLSLMAVQFGVLARLTWWEYSWDIMEPVTYFVTYGTTMAMYAYYCLTKSEYAFENIRDRLFLISIHKKAKRKNFDVDKYNQLKRQIAETEYDLRRLRDPINLQLPPHIDRSQRVTPIQPPEGGSNTSDTRIVSAVTCDKKPISFRLPFLEPKN